MSTVSVKWQKKVFESIEIDTNQPPFVFKAQLYDLSGVPPERQKIMVKGGLLKVIGFTAFWTMSLQFTNVFLNLFGDDDDFTTYFFRLSQDDADWSTIGLKNVKTLLHSLLLFP